MLSAAVVIGALIKHRHINSHAPSGSAVDSASDCRGDKFESQLDNKNFMEIDHEIISTVILPFHWFKKGSYLLW